MGQKLGGGCAHIFLGKLGPHQTQSHLCDAKSLTSISSGILVHPAAWSQRTLAKNWGLCPFTGGGAGSLSNAMLPRLRLTILPSGILICSRLATIDMRQKMGVGCAALPLFLGGGLGPHLTQCRLGRRLSPYQVAS